MLSKSHRVVLKHSLKAGWGVRSALATRPGFDLTFMFGRLSWFAARRMQEGRSKQEEEQEGLLETNATSWPLDPAPGRRWEGGRRRPWSQGLRDSTMGDG